MKKTTTIGLLLLAVCVALGVASVRQGFAEADVDATTTIQAAKLSGRSTVALVRPTRPAFEDGDPLIGYLDRDTGDEYWVDSRTRQVRRFANADAYARLVTEPKEMQKDVGPRAVRELAAAYVRERLGDHRAANGRVAATRRAGGNEDSYLVQYDEYVQGVRTFNCIRMRFAPNGTMLTCMTEDYPVTVGTVPVLDEADAAKIVAEAHRLRTWSTENCELRMIRSTDGVQRLCWDIVLRTKLGEGHEQGFGGLIDANDGSIVESYSM